MSERRIEVPDPESDEPKEVFAFFGLASYAAQVLEHELLLLATALHMVSVGSGTREWVDTLFERLESKTFGGLLSEARAFGVEPAVSALLARALEARNRLTHRFFAEHSVDFMSAAGRRRMIAELRQAAILFSSADKASTTIREPLHRRLGITKEMAEAEFARLVAEAAQIDSADGGESRGAAEE